MREHYFGNPDWNFNIRTEEVKAVESGEIVPRIAIFREEDNKFLGLVSKKYQLILNRDLVNAVEMGLSDQGVEYQLLYRGCTEDGKKFYSKYRFPDVSIDFGDGDEVNLMLELFNSYDGSTSFGYDFGGWRLVCTNGLRAFEKVTQFKVIHVGHDVEELETVFRIDISAIVDKFFKLGQTWQQFKLTPVEEIRLEKILETLQFGKVYEKVFNELMERYGQLKTAWDLYNLFTFFTTHWVEQRNFDRARAIAVKAYQEILSQVEGN